VLDTGQGRQPVQSRRRGRNGHDANLAPSHCAAKVTPVPMTVLPVLS
jgi:hypothetical protein